MYALVCQKTSLILVSDRDKKPVKRMQDWSNFLFFLLHCFQYIGMFEDSYLKYKK